MSSMLLMEYRVCPFKCVVSSLFYLFDRDLHDATDRKMAPLLACLIKFYLYLLGDPLRYH